MLVEEESLNAAFMNQLASKVRAVRERKNSWRKRRRGYSALFPP